MFVIPNWPYVVVLWPRRMDTTEAEDDDEGGRRGRTQENEATSMDATSVGGCIDFP